MLGTTGGTSSSTAPGSTTTAGTGAAGSCVLTGWYQGRATHIHFRVYLALDLHATSQLAFPTDVQTAVYGSRLYVARGQNATTTASDGIFADGVTYQLPTMTADAATGGYDAVLTVGIA